MKIEQQAQTRAFLIQSFGSVRGERTQHCGRGCFDVTIQKCLWHTACAKYSYPELCRLFCDADNIRQAEQNRLYIYKKTKYRRRLLRFPFFQKAIHRKSLILCIK